MARFEYRSLLEMPARPGVKYRTVYIKQSPEEHKRLLTWLCQTGQDILAILELDPVLSEWFSEPHEDFRRSRRGEYYSPEDLLTDMIHQLSLGHDLPQAMADRWNRLTESTPWQIELDQASVAKKPQHQVHMAVFE